MKQAHVRVDVFDKGKEIKTGVGHERAGIRAGADGKLIGDGARGQVTQRENGRKQWWESLDLGDDLPRMR